ncbi:MAG: dynamin family protein, partial [Candidatus Sericytochromatia bacterium]
MKNLKEFQIKKEKIINIYEKIKSSEYLSVTNEYKNEIENLSKNLQKEQFNISICGQIKVGKSTFLNDFLFENYVLPSDDIPETAKLTHISYDENNSYTAYFYSLNEWEAIKKLEIDSDKGEKINYFNKYIKEQLKIIELEYQSKGEFFYPKIILEQGSKSGNNFSDLKDYVSARGKYTPFVKYLELKHNSEKIKGITIVDTPGTNDPNPIRSKVTEEWIGKSDAVVFLMYSGKALTSQDTDFINNFLLPIPSEKILVGLSKIDVVDDYKRPKEYVEKSLKQMGLDGFSKSISSDNIYSISPMASLYPKIWRKYKNNQIVISNKDIEDIENYFCRRDESSKIQEIENKKGFIPEFESAIAEKLIKNKGEALLNSHTQKIIAFFEKEINNKNREIEKIKSNLNDIYLSDKELEDKISNAINIDKKLKETKREITKRNDEIIINMKNELDKALIEVSIEIEKKAIIIINNNSTHYLEKNLFWDIKNIIENILRNEFNMKLRNILEKAKDEFNNIQLDLKEKLVNFNIFSMTFINSLFISFNVSSLIDDIESNLQKYLGEQIIKSFLVSKWLFWTNEEKSKDNIISLIKSLENDMR